jgi:hypothetical protein
MNALVFKERSFGQKVSKNPIDEGDFHGFLPVAVNV